MKEDWNEIFIIMVYYSNYRGLRYSWCQKQDESYDGLNGRGRELEPCVLSDREHNYDGLDDYFFI